MKSIRRKKWLFILLAGLAIVLVLVLGLPIVSSLMSPANPALLYKYDQYSGTADWSPDGRYIVSGGKDNTVQIWEPFTGKHLATYTGHSEGITTAVWSPDGKYIVSAGFPDGIAHVWDAKTGKGVIIYKGQGSKTKDDTTGLSLAWSPDSKEIASVNFYSLKIWNAKTGIPRLIINIPEVVSVAWSPDGKTVATANGHMVQFWDAATGTLRKTYTRPTGIIAWSPDGKKIASVSYKTVQVWDAGSGATLVSYTGHTDQVNCIAWSPDGKKIASGGSTDGTVEVRDSFTGKHYATYMPPRFLNIVLREFVNSVAWSPDGKYLASATSSVQIWKAP